MQLSIKQSMKKNIENLSEIIMTFGQKKEKELLGLNLTQKLKITNIASQMFTLDGFMMEL